MHRLAGGQLTPFALEGLPPYPDDGMVHTFTGKSIHLDDLIRFDQFWVGRELVWLTGTDPRNEDDIVRHLEWTDHPMHEWSRREADISAAWRDGRRSGARSGRSW